MSRIKANILIYATMSFGLGSLMLFSLFLFLGSFTILDLGLNTGQSLLLDAGLSLLFFLQHSIMVRQPVRKRLAGIIPDIFYSAFYALTSGMALLIVMLFWQKTPAPLFTAEGASYWLLRMLFFLCIAGFSWGTRSLGSFDPLGVKAIRRHMREKDIRADAAEGPGRLPMGEASPLFLFTDHVLVLPRTHCRQAALQPHVDNLDHCRHGPGRARPCQ